MPLDPASQAVVEMMSQYFEPIGSDVLDAQEARALLAANAAPRPAEEVTSVEDRVIPGAADGPDLRIRIYRPSDQDGLPLVTFLHGGGWVLGDLDSHDANCRAITNNVQVVVVSVDYRLAPEARFPAAADDALAALCWVQDHAAELGGDPARIVVAGDSAGGNLAAVTAVRHRDTRRTPLVGQLLAYPVTDFAFDTPSYDENGTGYFLTTTHMRWFWEQYLGPDGDGRHPHASPLQAADLAGVAPAVVAVAEFDPLRDEGVAYAEKLAASQVPTVMLRCDGVIHGFLGLGDFLPPAKAATADVHAALAKLFATA
jgi:acetyl esterase